VAAPHAFRLERPVSLGDDDGGGGGGGGD